MYMDYIAKIEKLCGAKRDYVILLKYGAKDEAIKKILDRVDELMLKTGVMKKARHRGREIRVFATGKLIIKDVEDEEEVKSILEELLS